jgi:hypothetical protein
MDKPASAGKTAAIAGMAATQSVTLLLYIVHKFGIDDMTPEVAAAIIGVATTIAGAIMHGFQRSEEKKASIAITQGSVT